MDHKTRELLRECNLQAHITSFRDHEVDYDSLLSLSNDALLTLFGGKLGPHAKFTAKLMEHGSLSKSVTDTERVTPTTQPCVQDECKSEQGDDSNMKAEELDLGSVCPPLGWVPSDAGKSRLDPCEDLDIMEESSRPEGPFSTAHDSLGSSVFSSFEETSSTERDSSFSNDECTAQSKDGSENSVEHYLRSSCIGMSLLMLGKEKRLNQYLRAKLAHEIIVGELGAFGSNIITGSRFEELAEEIIHLFPQEVKETYYIPRQSSRKARGVLPDKYNNLQSFLRKAGLRKLMKRTDFHSSRNNELLMCTRQSPSVASIECRRTVRVTGDVHGVNFMVKKKAVAVLDAFQNHLSSFHGAQTNPATHLVPDEFLSLLGGSNNQLEANWRATASRLLRLSKQGEQGDTPDAPLRVLKVIPGFFKQPLIISSLLGRKKAIWRPSLWESSQGFILYVKDLLSLEIEIQRLRKKLLSVDRTLMPIPVAVGPSEQELIHCFVVMPEQRFQCSSVLAAVDACFKAYRHLQCGYTCLSSYSWLFVQQAIYGLTTDEDFTAPAVSTMVTAYRNIEPLQQ